MADWIRRSSAGEPSPAIPKEDIPNAVHLDFLNRPSAARIAFPCNRDGGSVLVELLALRSVKIMPTRWLIRMIAEEGLLLPRADRNGGYTKMAVAPPATMGPPFQPRQCQPAECGLRRGGSRRRVKCPSSSQLPPLPKHATVTFVNNEASDEEEEEAMLSGRVGDKEVDAVLYCDEEGEVEEEGEPEVLDACCICGDTISPEVCHRGSRLAPACSKFKRLTLLLLQFGLWTVKGQFQLGLFVQRCGEGSPNSISVRIYVRGI